MSGKSDNTASLGGKLANQYVLTTDPRLTDPRSPKAGSSNYVQNTTTQQTANFNINGTGRAGIFNASQYNLGGLRMFANGGLLDNLYVGLNSGQSTTGTANAFFGTDSGASNTTGLGNSFFGWESGPGNTNGSENSFFGGSAGGSNTTGSNNSFMGRLSGNLSTTGSNNSALGFESGEQITTGNNNT